VILALAGGVGGAKLAHGLSMQLSPRDLRVVVNTGDDFAHLGLQISPDLDTVMYWLAGANDAERGWGLANETWNFMSALARLGGPTWFNLGDRDLATHVERTRRLANGDSLSAVTQFLCDRFGVAHRLAPMTDDPVRTIVHSDEGELEFQQYFVARRCQPRVLSVEFRHARNAAPSPDLDQALADGALAAIVICPSNPLLSIEPILHTGDVRMRITQSRAPVVAVSPIVGGKAMKGPAAKIFEEIGRDASALEIARYYLGVIDGIVIDSVDAALKAPIEALGLYVAVTDTVMKNQPDQARLAELVIEFAADLSRLPRRQRT
jgi:LPPG:FO 2-phospho-L-lactate transferase